MKLHEKFASLSKLIEAEFSRTEKRFAEYYTLLSAIEVLCENSETKLAQNISELIDKHYEL